MPTLHVALLGICDVHWDNGTPVHFATEKARALLAYLIVHRGRAHSRESLADLLWPNAPATSGLHSLSNAILRLQQALGPDAIRALGLEVSHRALRLAPTSAVQIDIDALDHSLATWRGHAHRRDDRCAVCATTLAEAVARVQGTFLEDIRRIDSADFELWLTQQRERRQVQVMAALEWLVHYAAGRGDTDIATEDARRALELDPYHEEMHRTLMRLLARSGQRTAALHKYRQCERLLRHELHLSPEPETEMLLHQIRAQQLAPAEPPSTLVSALPEMRGTFFARSAELGAISAFLNTQGHRICTLVGPAGVGKTHLLLQAVRAAAPDFRDGALAISLAGCLDGEQAAATIGTALGVTARERLADRLVRAMRDKEILLALDAAEHLACELSFLEELLDASPASRVLITSRARLGLVSEEVLDIGGLPFPPDALIASPQPTVSELLLIERARRVCPRFATTIADAKAAARICHLLEGLPLALELAAEAARTHTAAEIAELLRSVTAAENVTWYLPGASAALDRSWLLLTSRARAVLAQLAVFPGSFSIDAANMVCALQDVHVCAPLLATLVEYSLLGRDQDGRYRMHLLMRQYAMTRLQREGDPTETKRRYRSYMLGFLSARTSGLVAGCPTPALEEVEREFDNISAAWEQAAAAEPTALAGALDALYLFCTIRGRSLDGDRLLRIALGAMSRPATDKDPALATVRARVAMRAALFKQALGQEREAQVLLEEGLAVLCSRLGRRTSPRPQGLEQPAGRIGQALSYRVDRRVVYSARGE